MKLILPLIILMIITPSFALNTQNQTVSIQLSGEDQLQFAGYYIAKEKGLYNDVGINLEIKKFDPKINIAADVLSEKSHFGIGNESIFLDQTVQKNNLLLLAATFQHSPLVLYSLKSSGIKTISDLKGKVISIDADKGGHASINGMLMSGGINEKSYIKSNDERVYRSLTEGRVDAMSANSSSELFELKEKGYKPTIFNPKDFGFDLYSNLLFTSRFFEEKNPELVRAFYHATLKGWEYAFQNIDETIALFYKKYNPLNKSKKALFDEAKELRKIAFVNDISFGDINKAKLQNNLNTFLLLGLIETCNIDLDKIIYRDEQNFTPAEQAWIDKKTPITYVYDVDWAPFEWTNEIRRHSGIIADILGLIAQKSSIKFEAIHTNSWEKAVLLAEEHYADMYSAIPQDTKRSEYMNFTSNNIFEYRAALVKNKSDTNNYQNLETDLTSKTIAIVKSSSLGNYVKTKYPQANYIEVVKTENGFKRLEKGDFDLFAINSVTAEYMINIKGYTELEITKKLDKTFDLKIALSKNIPKEAISIIDKTLSRINQNQINAIYNKWTTPVKKESYWLYISLIVVFSSFVILYFIYRQNVLKKEKNKILDENNSLNKQQQSLIHQAYHDDLTELPNRTLFKDRLLHSVEKAKRHSTNLAVFFIDLDEFKIINDTYGHSVGDKLLKAVSSRLKDAIRKADSISRLGGDEFTVILEDLKRKKDASILAEKIVQNLSSEFKVDEHSLFISCSIGISFFPQDSTEYEELLINADTAMYHAKERGKNNFQFYLPEMERHKQTF